MSVFFLGSWGMNRSAEQTNRPRTASRFTRFVCPALRFIPHEPRKKDTHSLITCECFRLGLFQRPTGDMKTKSIPKANLLERLINITLMSHFRNNVNIRSFKMISLNTYIACDRFSVLQC